MLTVSGIAVLLGLLLGCSAGAEELALDGVAEEYRELRRQASQLGASAEQLQVLDDAISRDQRVTFEEYKTAKDLEMECVAELGFNIAEVREIRHANWIEIAYLFGGFPDADSGDALLDDVDACAATHAAFIELAYQSYPTQEESDALLEEHRDEFVACLESRGAGVDSQAPWAELIEQDQQQLGAGADQTCLEELGLVEGE